MGKKKTYVEVLLKVVTNTVGTHSKPKNTDNNKIMEPLIKANCSLRGDNKIKGGENIHFEIEYKMSDGKKNKFTPEREQKVEVKVFASQHMTDSRVSNCSLDLKSDNVLSADDEDLVNILANLGETEINISHINENSSDMSNTDLGESSSTSTSITSDAPSINRATLTDERRISGVFCSKTAFNLGHKILTETEIKVLDKGLDFAPVQRTLNEPELRKAFEEFYRRMRCK